eukprot:TRINITY_DN1522_c0_g1_i1.p1 TRINITY_DN1522_c0_g1~~TRINITY_DN1522_c0_g1_i1.p1  ORF type:complete len:403 (-),score=170.83 TRINITY_DN1522_c0_g1_i1:98-1261(-)
MILYFLTFILIVFILLKFISKKEDKKYPLPRVIKKALVVGQGGTKLSITNKTGKLYVITGGSGFLGSHLIEALIHRGEKVRIFDRVNCPLFENDNRVEFIQGDITNFEETEKAIKGAHVVFHIAAIIDYWRRLPHEKRIFEQINVLGSQNVLDSCLKHKIEKLIFMSSALVIINLNEPLRNGDEQFPYATIPVNHYATTKIAAEKLILSANAKNGLATAALRAHGLFGPRDQLIIESFYRNNVVDLPDKTHIHDWVYVENVVHALLLTEKYLHCQSENAGQALFISNNEPIVYMDFWNRILNKFNRKNYGINSIDVIGWPLAKFVEWFASVAPGKFEGTALLKLRPPLLYLVRNDYYFSTQKAKRLIGYEPLYSLQEAIDKCYWYYS